MHNPDYEPYIYYVYDPAYETEQDAQTFRVFEYSETRHHQTAAEMFADDHYGRNSGPGSVRWFNGVNLRVRREDESAWKTIRVEAQQEVIFTAKEI